MLQFNRAPKPPELNCPAESGQPSEPVQRPADALVELVR
jgi:hypothetical protein